MSRCGLGFLVLAVLVGKGQSGAAPVCWQPAEGGNGHFYDLLPAPGGDSPFMSWPAAKAYAETLTFNGVQGHLATATSAAEWDFIVDHLPWDDMAHPTGAWLGGYQDTSAPDSVEPAGGWRWITGEPWEYTGWASGEPNDYFGVGSENYLEGVGVWGAWNDCDQHRALYVEYPLAADLNLLVNGSFEQDEGGGIGGPGSSPTSSRERTLLPAGRSCPEISTTSSATGRRQTAFEAST